MQEHYFINRNRCEKLLLFFIAKRSIKLYWFLVECLCFFVATCGSDCIVLGTSHEMNGISPGDLIYIVIVFTNLSGCNWSPFTVIHISSSLSAKVYLCLHLC
jgi:hypothetical protein